jgi:hypothetical protein
MDGLHLLPRTIITGGFFLCLLLTHVGILALSPTHSCDGFSVIVGVIVAAGAIDLRFTCNSFAFLCVSVAAARAMPSFRSSSHQHCTEYNPASTLAGLSVHICPHYLSWAVFQFNFAFCDFIFDKEIPHVDVLGALCTGSFPVLLKKHSTLVILVK